MAFTNIGVGEGPRKRTPPPPPLGAKKPGVAVMIGVGGPKKPPMGGPPTSPMDDHESGETPAFEGQEEYGAKLMSDIEQAGASVGIHDPQKARQAAGAFLDAIAKCLSGGGEETPPDMGDMGDDGSGGGPL